MKTDDLDLLLGLVKVLMQVATLLRSQVEEHTRPEIVQELRTRIQRIYVLAHRQLKVAYSVSQHASGDRHSFLGPIVGGPANRRHESGYTGQLRHLPRRAYAGQA